MPYAEYHHHDAPRYEAAKNMSLMLICNNAVEDDRQARRKQGVLPDAANNPVLKLFEYLTLSTSMYDKSPPSASIVTPEAPVKVVKNVHTSIAIIAMPPGSHPNHALKRFTRRSPALLSESMNPARVKSGMAGIEWLMSITYASLGITSRDPPDLAKR